MSVAGTDVLVKPNAPSFDGTTVTINGTTGAVYHNGNDNSVMADNSTAAVPSGQTLRVYAVPASGHYFENNVDDEWNFTNEN